MINAVKEGMGKKTSLVNPEEYQTPEDLKPTYDRLSQLIDDAKRKGEEIYDRAREAVAGTARGGQ